MNIAGSEFSFRVILKVCADKSPSMRHKCQCPPTLSISEKAALSSDIVKGSCNERGRPFIPSSQSSQFSALRPRLRRRLPPRLAGNASEAQRGTYSW